LASVPAVAASALGGCGLTPLDRFYGIRAMVYLPSDPDPEDGAGELPDPSGALAGVDEPDP